MSWKNNQVMYLKKFSNIALFERREKNNSEVKKQKKILPLKLYKNKIALKEENKTNLDFNQILLSFYTFQTESNSTTKSSSKKVKNNIKAKSIFNKTSNNFNDASFPFYLTETEPNCKIIKKTHKKPRTRNRETIKINNNKLIINYEDIIFQRNFKTFTNFNQKKNYDFKEINNEDNLLSSKENRLKTIYNANYFNTKQYVDKTRKFLLYKYNLSIKNERKKRNEEVLDNKVEMIDDKIRSLKNVKSLYIQSFSHKLYEYIKFIFKKIELERKFNSKLLSQIYSLKKDISRLNNRIKKLEVEKYNIIQWLFFQIKVKEKKLNLPNYYVKILENIKRVKAQRRTARADIRVITQPIKKNKSNITVTDKAKIVGKENMEHLFNGISHEEINRILKYKQELIFNTPEELMDEIKNIENKNIKLFSQVDDLHSDIKILKDRFSRELNEKIHNDNDAIDKIKEKELELEENKKRYKINYKLITDYKNERLNISKNKNRKNSNEQNINNPNEEYIEEAEFGLNSKKIKLYNTVEQLFITCKDIEIKKNKNNFSSENQKYFFKKGSSTKEEEILEMMEFIEVRTCHLLNIFSIYKNPNNPNYEFIRKLRSNFLRKRKIEKAELAKLEKQIKYMKLIREVEEKNNKLLFLQNRRIDFKNYFEWENDQKKGNISKKRYIYKPVFEDFLFGINDENFNSTEDNKNNDNRKHYRIKK